MRNEPVRADAPVFYGDERDLEHPDIVIRARLALVPIRGPVPKVKIFYCSEQNGGEWNANAATILPFELLEQVLREHAVEIREYLETEETPGFGLEEEAPNFGVGAEEEEDENTPSWGEDMDSDGPSWDV